MSTGPRLRATATDSQPRPVCRGVVATARIALSAAGLSDFGVIARASPRRISRQRRLDERGCARVIVSGLEVFFPDGVPSLAEFA